MEIIHKNVYEELINTVTKVSKERNGSEIVWCGENKWIYRVLKALREQGIVVDVVLDNSPMKKGIITDCYEIKGFEWVHENARDRLFFICSLHGQEMLEQLLSLGVERRNIFLARPIEYETEKFVRNFHFDTYKWHKLNISELQAHLFKMLSFFADICEKHGLRYYLYDGTLIGAVRHKGFIPWDDDIDVAMPYEDYLKLCEIFKDNKEYSLLSWNRNDNYQYALPRIVSNDTRIIIPEYSVMGLFLDIFLLGGYPQDQDSIEEKWADYKKAEEKWESFYILKGTVLESEDTRGELFEGLFNCPFDSAERVGVMRTERQNKWTAPKQWFSDTVDVEFCGRLFKAPAGYDSYLKMKYGNYMKVPDVEKRESHSLDAWTIE